jgi:hypothetical protein
VNSPILLIAGLIVLVVALVTLVIALLLSPLLLSYFVWDMVWRRLRKPSAAEDVLSLSTEHLDATRPLIIAIHGTWAARAAWALPGSEFHSELNRRIRDRSPRNSSIDAQEPLWYAFQWSGRNTVADRADAIGQLTADLQALFARDADRVVAIIAHSHGGNIAFKAAENFPGNRNLTLITLATPFLATQPRLGNDVFVPLLLGVNALVPAAVLGFTTAMLSPDARLAWAVGAVVLAVGGVLSLRAHRRFPAAQKIMLESTLDPHATTWLRDRSLIVSRLGDEADGGLKIASLVNSWVMKSMREMELLSVVGGANRLIRSFSPKQPVISLPNPPPVTNIASLFATSAAGRIADVVAMWLGLLLLFLLKGAVGSSSGLVAATVNVTSGETPPGEWRHLQSAWSNEERAAFLSHSQVYEDPKVLDEIGQWLTDRIRSSDHP